MFDHKALAVLVAALDGHNPNITHQPDGTITLTTGRGRSDLALATEDLQEGIAAARERRTPVFRGR